MRMKRCSTAELRNLEIVNLCDGARLGYACDFEFDNSRAAFAFGVISGYADGAVRQRSEMLAGKERKTTAHTGLRKNFFQIYLTGKSSAAIG